MMRAFMLTLPFLAAIAVAGCGSDKQWYKPNTEYTVADFRRDRAACDKDRVLDEACMRQKGWIPLSQDREPPPPAMPVTKGRYQ